MKVLIVDDERLARVALLSGLQKIEERLEVRQAGDVLEALALIEEEMPDLVFLDIEMPALDGFDFLAHFEKPTFKVIFVTAYQHYAVRAFEEQALDYILKPFSQERLQKAFLRVKSLEQNQHIDSIQEMKKSMNKYLENIILTRGVYTDIVNVNDILYIKVEGRYCEIFCEDSHYLSMMSLQQLELQLSPQMFFRVHRNYLINVKHMNSIISNQDGFFVEISHKIKIPLSRRAKAELKNLWASSKDPV